MGSCGRDVTGMVTSEPSDVRGGRGAGSRRVKPAGGGGTGGWVLQAGRAEFKPEGLFAQENKRLKERCVYTG